jgi:DNA-binding transcriptional ArsR family regulator
MAAGPEFDTDTLKALGHPLRLRILEAITEQGEASPVGLSRELEVPLATVSHHVRVLRDLGRIAITRTKPRRGAVEHFYRAINRPFIDDTEWERLALPMRRGLAGQTLRRIFFEASRASELNGFDDAGACVARMPMELDERGWSELSELLVEVLRSAEAIQQRSDARASSPLRASNLALLHFGVSDAERTAESKRAGRPQLPPR